jgi:hypothetical protein
MEVDMTAVTPATTTIRSHSVDKKADKKVGNGHSHPNATFFLKLITPQVAESYMAKNTSNRNVREREVETLTRQMTDDLWMFNGDTIKFDWTGALLDGQHRLLACIKSGKAFMGLIVTGLDPEVFKTLDNGAKRVFADAALLMDEPNPCVLGAALMHLWRHTTGRSMSKRVSGTTRELDITLKEHPGIRESLKQSYHGGPRLITPSLLTFLHYICAQKDQEKADQFYTSLRTGENLGAQNPINVLRTKLIRNAADKRRFDNDSIARFTLKAWNAWREGRRMTTLVVRPGEAFPEVL